MIGAPGTWGLPVRTILIDDHPAFLMALVPVLRQLSGIEIVGQAHSGGAGLRLAAELKPSLVLVDFSMPDMNGADVTLALKTRDPSITVIILSNHAEQEYMDAAKESGADGYALKSNLEVELLPKLRQLTHPASP